MTTNKRMNLMKKFLTTLTLTFVGVLLSFTAIAQNDEPQRFLVRVNLVCFDTNTANAIIETQNFVIPVFVSSHTKTGVDYYILANPTFNTVAHVVHFRTQDKKCLAAIHD